MLSIVAFTTKVFPFYVLHHGFRINRESFAFVRTGLGFFPETVVSAVSIMA